MTQHGFTRCAFLLAAGLIGLVLAAGLADGTQGAEVFATAMGTQDRLAERPAVNFGPMTPYSFIYADETATAKHVLGLSNRRAGICSLPRVGDGKLAVAMAQNSRLTVHALGEDAKQLAAARAIADEAGIMGRTLYIEQGTTASNPLANGYADMVVVADAADSDLAALPAQEIRRICAPYRGVAIIGRAKDCGPGLTKDKLADWAKGLDLPDVKIIEDDMGLWARAVMPPLKGGDEWTHFWHDAGNNSVSTDTEFKIHDDPATSQPADGPKFTQEPGTPCAHPVRYTFYRRRRRQCPGGWRANVRGAGAGIQVRQGPGRLALVPQRQQRPDTLGDETAPYDRGQAGRCLCGCG